jgi:hypothetical protein
LFWLSTTSPTPQLCSETPINSGKIEIYERLHTMSETSSNGVVNGAAHDPHLERYKASDAYKDYRRLIDNNWPAVEQRLQKLVDNGTYDASGKRLKPLILPADMREESTTDVG